VLDALVNLEGRKEWVLAVGSGVSVNKTSFADWKRHGRAAVGTYSRTWTVLRGQKRGGGKQMKQGRECGCRHEKVKKRKRHRIEK